MADSLRFLDFDWTMIAEEALAIGQIGPIGFDYLNMPFDAYEAIIRRVVAIQTKRAQESGEE